MSPRLKVPRTSSDVKRSRNSRSKFIPTKKKGSAKTPPNAKKDKDMDGAPPSFNVKPLTFKRLKRPPKAVLNDAAAVSPSKLFQKPRSKRAGAKVQAKATGKGKAAALRQQDGQQGSCAATGATQPSVAFCLDMRVGEKDASSKVKAEAFCDSLKYLLVHSQRAGVLKEGSWILGSRGIDVRLVFAPFALSVSVLACALFYFRCLTLLSPLAPTPPPQHLLSFVSGRNSLV